MNARYRIEHWFERLAQPGGQMKREDVCFLMVQARHLIEASGTPERYPVVNFYADWSVHTALDRSPVCFEALRDITRAIAENMAPTSPDLTSQISRIIGFPKLRRELMALFLANNLSVVVFEFYENWKGFVMFLRWHLAGQPIGFPVKPTGAARRIREEMLALQRPHNVPRGSTLRSRLSTTLRCETDAHLLSVVRHWHRLSGPSSLFRSVLRSTGIVGMCPRRARRP
jgi:hypothetical protein